MILSGPTASLEKKESCEMGKSVAQMFLEKLNFICKHTFY